MTDRQTDPAQIITYLHKRMVNISALKRDLWLYIDLFIIVNTDMAKQSDAVIFFIAQRRSKTFFFSLKTVLINLSSFRSQ